VTFFPVEKKRGELARIPGIGQKGNGMKNGKRRPSPVEKEELSFEQPVGHQVAI